MCHGNYRSVNKWRSLSGISEWRHIPWPEHLFDRKTSLSSLYDNDLWITSQRAMRPRMFASSVRLSNFLLLPILRSQVCVCFFPHCDSTSSGVSSFFNDKLTSGKLMLNRSKNGIKGIVQPKMKVIMFSHPYKSKHWTDRYYHLFSLTGFHQNIFYLEKLFFPPQFLCFFVLCFFVI